MTRRILLTAALASLAAVRVAPAQDQPDFSGRWTVADAPPSPPPAGGRAGRGARPAPTMGSGWDRVITITQDQKNLTVEYPFFVRNDMQPPVHFTYPLDGSEHTDVVMMGRGMQRERSRVAWRGASLVITTTQTFPGLDAGRDLTSEVTRVLTLQAPGSLLVETTRSGALGGPSTSTRTVYTKG